ncbi:MAG: hypothetical protein A3E21_01215 [Sulfurimonas sp. RIFCSPHIGHO2_12_FULL_36_9]|uniref:DUF3313 family protein n=1 Tax=Sulfurimonas sp. RIFCSPLOWO2_12_36_12 TaxID=1802253 RepID=UPI0008C5AA42|nr:DUF3313 family protein [Sulfurimonas sp. RIFCSPLOWO2_12_36_12]OHD96662.1 MAG: hypothetical protein A3E21_01215 [Sulfurimonas sp. RIFCSPHIGHO2_12_FULL_36_9]OHE00180.1 MAG: hypothetical protein A2W82_02930 [Sulfurimonas sp. RIFCSPLOWO2_12_36_12]OHE00793.1 MAG: hypothetical protein A3J26_02890 [Sulfurimonas sp. RIFCSPLOWO2_02_FULL_36_28]OHE08553.1 MAG: hypothetical protein A3K14_04385 [Sulfurimonas sp. RIFCSPLOWO2_12_FULL_36_74]
MKLQKILSVAVFGVMFLMNGCAGKSVEAKNTGFFKDYEQFGNSAGLSATKSSKDVDMSKYKTVFVSPVEVISAIPQEQQTPLQKKLYKEISDYLTDGYKKEIQKSARYMLAETKSPNTLKLESAISTVEVHFDDDKWNQFSPIAMDITVTSYNSYADENVRILGEKRIVDSVTQEVLFESMDIIKDEKISLNGDTLEFQNIKPALDRWIEHIKNYFAK